MRVGPVVTLQGELRPPSDKSLTHRAYLLGAIASGESRVRMPLRGEDCESTLACVAALGLRHEWLSPEEVRLTPPPEWKQPDGPLDCGNSGTTLRLLSGLLASRALDTTLVGDASLSRRPMRRIAEPLMQMGAAVEGETPPLRIVGSERLEGITYRSPVASAQVKSCILLAGLRAEGVTSVVEPSSSRDHTERMLTAMGANLSSRSSAGLDRPMEWIEGAERAMPKPLYTIDSAPRPSEREMEELRAARIVSVEPRRSLSPFEFTVPADISSAAFFMVAAALLPDAEVLLRGVGVNPTRTGILDVLEQARVPFSVGEERSELGEPVADLAVRGAVALRPFTIEGTLVPRLIDEIPILAVLATQCQGTSTIRDARELRVKESDRIETMATALRAMNAEVETFDDGMAIIGPTMLRAARVDAKGDHRIAMAMAVASLLGDGESQIDGADAIATSYPGFERDLMELSIV